tara:strand:+ start:28 stop:624 length:597 start_codon:yes stop_codon:yes gene_type:complete
MLSGISHDLRTPLTRIKLQLSFLKDKEIANKLSDDVSEMEKMLNEYLQFAKVGAKEHVETFDLSELLNTIERKYDKKNIKFQIPERIFFNGKRNLIERCMNNLIDNSLKYSKKVEIKLEKIKNNIFITVEDNGPGIPKKEYENVFKPFYKIDKSRAETKSSVGLGLSISSDIIRSHGGDIKLGVSSLGGLKVRVFLPS